MRAALPCMAGVREKVDRFLCYTHEHIQQDVLPIKEIYSYIVFCFAYYELYTDDVWRFSFIVRQQKKLCCQIQFICIECNIGYVFFIYINLLQFSEISYFMHSDGYTYMQTKVFRNIDRCSQNKDFCKNYLTSQLISQEPVQKYPR